MNGRGFLRIIDEAFRPVLEGYGFVTDEPSMSGRFYRASFSSPLHSISISFEPGVEGPFIMVFSRKDGLLSDIDDRQATPRLTDLSTRYMKSVTSQERAQNDEAFRLVVTNDKEEEKLVRSAKELRLVLARYIGG